MEEREILEMSDFEYTAKGFNDLQAALKSWKIVRNPFAKFYDTDIEVVIEQDINFKVGKYTFCPLF